MDAADQAKGHSHLWPLVGGSDGGGDKRTHEQLRPGTIDPDAKLCAQSVSLWWAILQTAPRSRNGHLVEQGDRSQGPTCASWLLEAQSTTLLSRVLLYYYFAEMCGGAGEVN